MPQHSEFHARVHAIFREYFGEPDSRLGRDDHWALDVGGDRPPIHILVNGTAEHPSIWVFDPHSLDDGVMRQVVRTEAEVRNLIPIIQKRVEIASARRVGGTPDA
jgi:hypothetical protein